MELKNVLYIYTEDSKADNDIIDELSEEFLNEGIEFTSVPVEKIFVQKVYYEKMFNKTDNIVIAGKEVEKLGIEVDIGLGEDYRGGARYVSFSLNDIGPDYVRECFARKKHIPLEIAKTGRFVIREISLEDLDKLYELYDTLSDCPFVEPLYEREEEEIFTKNYIDNMYGFFGYGLWLVFDRKTGELVARAGIENRSIDGKNCQEIGYIVDKRLQRQGIATEVCEKIMELSKERFGIKELYLVTDKHNNASIKLANKLGFKKFGEDGGCLIMKCSL